MLILVFLLASAAQQATPAPPSNPELHLQSPLVLSIERCIAASGDPDQRVVTPPEISPGLPPLFSFRYYEGKTHGRFSSSDLMLDDAGH